MTKKTYPVIPKKEWEQRFIAEYIRDDKTKKLFAKQVAFAEYNASTTPESAAISLLRKMEKSYGNIEYWKAPSKRKVT